MQNRRNNRKRRRRGRFGFLYKLLSVILICGAILAGCMVFFRVNKIEAEGGVRYKEAEIIEASGIKVGENLLLLNKYRIARQVLSTLPYVNEVSIRRRIPDTLEITVSESTPVASIGSETEWWLMDAGGKLLEKVNQADAEGYSVVTGVIPILPSAGSKLAAGSENSAKLKSLTELLSALTDRDMAGRVSAVDLTEVTTIKLRYDGRFDVLLPMTADFPRKVWRLDEVVKLLEDNESGTLDLTGEKGYFRPD